MSAPASSPKKSPKKASKPKVAASHPPYQAMVKAAVKNLKDRQGSSRAAILKYIVQNYKVGLDVKKISAHLRAALKRGVATGALKQAKGVGANGRFRLGESAKASPKKRAAPKKKPAAKKPKPAAKKSSPKKKASPKKAKSPKKPKAAKSPKKPKAVKKPAKKSPAKKVAKKAKSPKKTPKKA